MPINLATQHVLDSIRERDLDLLLMIALNGSESFRNEFIEKVTGEHVAQFEKAWRGLFGPNGETDVTVVYRDSNGDRVAILIEDKIDACFQKGQSTRYRERGALGINNGDWARFKTCLCAPEVYAKPYAAGPDWDCAVYLEEVIAMLEKCEDDYTPFLADAVRRAVGKYETGGFVEIPAASEFWKRYREFCIAEFPELTLSRLSDRQGANVPWPCFAADHLPHRVRLEHKPSSNCVDLTLKSFTYQQALDRLSGRLPEGFAIKSTPPSSAIRLETSSIAVNEPFDDQIEALRNVFIAATRLLRLWPKLRPLLGFPEPIEEEMDGGRPASLVTPKLDLSLSSIPRGGWQIGDFTDRERLEVLAKYVRVFTAPDFEYGRWSPIPTHPEQGQSITFEFTPEIKAFQIELYEYGWILDTTWNWPDWAKSEEAKSLFEDPAVLFSASMIQIQRVLTVRLRIARVQGVTVLAEDFNSGLLLKIVRRAAAILSNNSKFCLAIDD